jgi:hypothetical protein
MGLVLKHVKQTKSGSFQCRRRVPKAVNNIITKREFKQKLGDSRRDALAAYPRYHAQVEREIEAAIRRLEGAQVASRPDASDREAYAEALRRRADLIEAGASEEELALSADAMAESYAQDEWEPVGVPPVDRHTINLMRLGPDRYKAPEQTALGPVAVERKTIGQRSYRVATRRQSFSLPNMISIRLRLL